MAPSLSVLFMETLYNVRERLDVQLFDDSSGTRKYLVTSPDGSYLVSKRLALTLQALDVIPQTVAEIRERVFRQSGLDFDVAPMLHRIPSTWFTGTATQTRIPPGFLWRRELLGQHRVAQLGRAFAFLVTPAALGAFALFLIFSLPDLAAQFRQMASVPLSISDAGAIFTLFALSVIFHEIGHAAAAERFGIRPRSMGIALYLAFPSLYTDVTDVWRLTRLRRAAVDLSGVYFQAIFVLAISALHQLTNHAFLVWFTYLAVLDMAQTLNPFLKMDGYWILSDVSGIPNLHSRAFGFLQAFFRRTADTPNSTRAQRWILRCYLAAGALFFLLFCTLAFHGAGSALDVLDRRLLPMAVQSHLAVASVVLFIAAAAMKIVLGAVAAIRTLNGDIKQRG